MQEIVSDAASSYASNLNHYQDNTVSSKKIVRSDGNRDFTVTEL